MTITNLLIILIILTFIDAGVTILFILRLTSVKKSKKLKKKAKKTKKIKARGSAKVTDCKKEKRSKTGSKTQKKPVIDLDPNNYIQNLAKEALETSKDIVEMTDNK